MKSRTTPDFRVAIAALPAQVRAQCRAAYRLFAENPRHTGLQFKKVHPSRPVYSARVSRRYRAVCILEGDTAVWFWVGSHAEYDRLLAQL